MRYSKDLRKRVIDFITTGGSKAEASRRFQVSRRCIYSWLDAADPFTYKKPGPRKPYRLAPEALTEHVKEFPDSTQKERAAHFGVSQRCICYGLKKIGCTRKKTFTYSGPFSKSGPFILTHTLVSKAMAYHRHLFPCSISLYFPIAIAF